MRVEVIGQSALGRDMYQMTINDLHTAGQRAAYSRLERIRRHALGDPARARELLARLWLKWSQPRSDANQARLASQGFGITRPVNNIPPRFIPAGERLPQGWDDWGPFYMTDYPSAHVIPVGNGQRSDVEAKRLVDTTWRARGWSGTTAPSRRARTWCGATRASRGPTYRHRGAAILLVCARPSSWASSTSRRTRSPMGRCSWSRTRPWSTGEPWPRRGPRSSTSAASPLA